MTSIQHPPSKQRHLPVLVSPFLEIGFPSKGRVFVDGTFGFGGHTRAILERFPNIEICIGIDRDEEALKLARETFADQRLRLVHDRFSNLRDILSELGISKMDGLLLDVGVSSYQLDEADRGFSFSQPGPLDMRMDRSFNGKSAQDLVDSLSETDLERIFSEFGEERFSRRIARAIVQKRRESRGSSENPESGLNSTVELAKLIDGVVPRFGRAESRIHPATRVFQALRIAVNDELGELRSVLETAIPLLNPDGRVSVISFHSLEDRIAKTFFGTHQRGCVCPPTFPVCNCGRKPTLEVLTRKPIVPAVDEMASNPRARSAKLRVARKIPLQEPEP